MLKFRITVSKRHSQVSNYVKNDIAMLHLTQLSQIFPWSCHKVTLEILMRQNVFKFGDTFWRQKTGTTMGTPLGANYARLYYGTWELCFADCFRTSLALYCHYIDDGIGLRIHHSDPHIDQLNFAAPQATMNSFGIWLLQSINAMTIRGSETIKASHHCFKAGFWLLASGASH
jgi:hypothetical protein